MAGVRNFRFGLIAVIVVLSVVAFACRPTGGSDSEARLTAAEGQGGAHLEPQVTPSGSTSPDVPSNSAVPTRSARELPPMFGVQFHATWDMYYTTPGGRTPNQMFWRHFDELAANKVGIIRVDIGWSTSQPSAVPPSLDHWYNQRIALVLREAIVRGIKVLVTLHQSPDWTRNDSGGDVKQFPDDPDAITPWATWLAETFGSQVTAWEVWNEPNLEEFTGIADASERARRYVPVLRASAQGLRAGDRDAVVVFGGPAQTDDVFIRACYAQEAKSYFDVMAVHPYLADQTKPPEATDRQDKARMTHLPAVVKVMNEYGDGHKPVWWTEFGFSVHSNDGVEPSQVWRKGVPNATQAADFLRRSFELARKQYPQVRVAIVYTAYKPRSDEVGHQYGYRIMEADGEPLPQLTTLRRYMAGYDGNRPLL